MLSTTDSTITVKNNRNIENLIDKKDIKAIKKRHFSVIKTALLPFGVAVVGVVILAAIYDGPQIGGDIRTPP